MTSTPGVLLDELARRAGMDRIPRQALIAAVTMALVICAWALWRWWPRTEAGAVEVQQAPAGVASTQAQEASIAASVVVHVTGSVRHSGVYELQAGTRVSDAVEAAGGLLPDAMPERVNLARVLTDGEQVHIPDEDEPVPGPGVAGATAGGAGGAGATSLVNLNTADAAALDTLPGVGPSTAEKIVADREANGPFGSIEDLGRVSGIGPKKLEQLRDLVCIQ